MKLLLIFILPLWLIFPPRQSDFTPFINFVSTKYKLPKAFEKGCNWYYAIVKVTTNDRNVVTGYQVLNNVGLEIKDSFKYLIGYKFSSKMAIHKQPIVFCFEHENRDRNCLLSNPNYYPSEIIGNVLTVFDSQAQKQPNTIFIYNLVTSVISDPVK